MTVFKIIEMSLACILCCMVFRYLLNRQEVEALKEVKKTIHKKHPNDGKVFFGFDEYKESLLSETNKDDCPKATVYNWLKRLKEWGYIVNPYEGVWKIIPETLEDVSS